jgi:hypothetical protein
MVYVLRSRKDSLGLAIKELARLIEPKGVLNATYTRAVRRNWLARWPEKTKDFFLLQYINYFLQRELL